MLAIWAWVKKHWKWIVFPIGVGGAVLGWFLWWRSRPEEDDTDSGTSDAAADEALGKVIVAGEERDAALEELEKDNLVKLAEMSEEQRAEYEKVKERPIDEVASWIDNL